MFDPVAEAQRVLDACGISPWRDKVATERQRLGRDLSLNELLKLAEGYEMTPAEIEEQRASWARQMKD
jgi:hypothetical protein